MIYHPARALMFAAALAAATVSSAGAEEEVLRLDMEKALSIAAEKNTELAMARLNSQKALNQEKEALGMALPDLDLSASYTYNGNVQKVDFYGSEFQMIPDEQYSLNASLSQYIYSGAVASGYRASKHLTSAAEKRRNAARNDVITDVKIKMYQAIYTRNVIRAHEEAVERLRSHLEDSKAREEVGLNTSYDTMRFETQLAEAIPMLIEARNNHDKAVSALLDSLGMNPLRKVEIEGALKYEPFSATLEEAVERAKSYRPELTAADESLSAAREVTTAAKSEFLPTLKAVGSYSYSNLGIGLGGESEWRNDWNIGLRLEYNLFDGRERASRISQRRVEQEMARLESEKVGRMILIEVKTAYDEFLRAGEFVDSQRKAVALAEESYRIAAERRREGVNTQLELLDAQVALTNAKINKSRSLYERSVALARLERAMGAVEEDK